MEWSGAANARRRTVRRVVRVLALAALLLGSVVPPVSATWGSAPSRVPGATPETLAALLSAPMVPVGYAVADRPVPGSQMVGPATATDLPILVTLAYSNQSSLNATLLALSNTASPEYHHYLTAAEFDARYSPSAGAYANALEYFESFDVQDLATFPDRVSIAFDVSAVTADAMFHFTLDNFTLGGVSYFAPVGVPELPSPLAASVDQVEGLSSYPNHLLTWDLDAPPGGDHRRGSAPGAHPVVSGYLAPPVVDGVQYEYAPDFQVAYDEQSLFREYGYPSNATVATILSGGQYLYGGVTTPYGHLSTGQYVGPFDPSDVDQFFNETLPAGEPHPVVTGVPVLGAVGPGPLASWDSTSASTENTLDLEMVGSTAPGAHIFNVYGPQLTPTDLDEAFAYILSPNATFSGLSNVSVITNSWGGADANDSSWYASLEEAQARGISVLASSGDSDDSPSSSRWTGTPVEFPSSMAYDDFGVTAVGGTTVTLGTASLEIASQVVWSDLSPASGGGPFGSAGGTSAVFPEPSWQRSSPEANSVIAGGGRGVPDVAGLANRTLLTLSVNGSRYLATNATFGGEFAYVAGTSIAAPLTAGAVATIDHALRSAGNAPLGFLNPELYALADEEYAPVTPESQPVGVFNSSYNSMLPALPFYDVTFGANAMYSALPGYDLVTGWGSLDAYNYTMYVLRTSSEGVFGRLSGVQDRFNLTGLRVTSTGAGSDFDASTQQNFFLANSLGAPVYWIQNVVYINGTPGDWSMNFTGWVVWPFWALYPSISVYEYNFPLSGLVEATPIDFDFETQLVNTSSPALTPTVVFSFGVAGTPTLYLPVPGAAYILGAENLTYSWEGVNYTNGPYPGGTFPEGFLAPQFAVVGGPSLGLGIFDPSTAGSIQASIEPYGTNSFYPAGTSSLPLTASQTGEESVNLAYTQTSGSSWSLAYSAGSETQGIVQFEEADEVPGYYTVQFNESGVPVASGWSVNLTGGMDLSATGSTTHLSAFLPNGSYPWVAAVGVPKATLSPSNGTVVVRGETDFIDLIFSEPNNTVTFLESGLPLPARWTVTIVSVGILGDTTASLVDRLAYGSYAYTVAGPNTTWAPSPGKGRFSIGTSPTTVRVDFTLVVYPVLFEPTFVGTSPVAWTALLGGVTVSGVVSNETLAQTNGTYRYEITVPSGYTVSPASGNVTISGAPAAVPFTITSVSHPPFALATGEYLALLALVVAGAAAVVLAIVMRRKRRRGPPSLPSSPGPPAGAYGYPPWYDPPDGGRRP